MRRRSALPLLPPSTPCLLDKRTGFSSTQDDVERHGCREVLVVALHYILKCDVDIRKDLYANVVLHHSVRVIGERMTETSLHRLPCRLENDDVASAGSYGMLGVPGLSCQAPSKICRWPS